MGSSTRRVVVGLLAALCANAPNAASTGGIGPIRFDYLSLEHGLSQSTVNCVFQDSRGFLWLGTEDGLNRFDGYDFTVYKNNPSDPATLSHDAVWSIDEDQDGNLWVGTSGGGLAFWDRAHDRFLRYGTAEGLASPYVRFVHVGRDGHVWSATRAAGVDRLEPESGTVTNYNEKNGSGLSDDHVYVIFTDRSGTVWIGTDAGLNRFDPGTESLVAYPVAPEVPGRSSALRVRAILEDSQGALWIGTYDGGLARFDPSSGASVIFKHDPNDPASLSHDQVRAILEDDKGRLWIGTSEGLNLLKPGASGFWHYRNDPADPDSLNDEHVMSLLQDRGGVIWIGTRTGGVNKWNPLAWQFGHRSVSRGSEGLSNKDTMAFLEDPTGNLWIGTFGGGIDVFDRVSGAIKRYHHDPEDPRSLSSDRVTELALDRQGTIWVGTLDGGLNRFVAETDGFVSYRHTEDRPESLAADGITSILEDRQGRLWVGTFGGGLDRFDRERGAFVHYRHDQDDPTTLGGDRVTCLQEDERGNIWVGTDGGGLGRLDPGTGKSIRFTHDSDVAGSLSANTVFGLYLDDNGTLWIGTRGGGLDEFADAADATDSVSFRNRSERDGLPNEVVYGILPDDGNLWLSTNRGLSRFNPRDESFVNYRVHDGLQSNEFHFGSHYRSPSGELFFGGLNGFNSFFPDQLKRNNHAPPVVLTSFLKFNQRVPDLGLAPEITSIDLGYKDDVVTFEFAALDYDAPEDNRYRYILEGFDRDWVDASHVRRVTYTNLDPGNYVFRVRGSNSDGVWSEDGLSVALHVDTPPWQTLWAYSLYGLALGGVVLAFVRAQQRKLKREAAYSRRLEREVEERTAELGQRNAELVKASITDSLTGLANRRFLLEYLEREIEQIRRRHGKLAAGEVDSSSFDMAFMMVDLDKFKTINDTCGHSAGDTVLQQVKTILEGACRSSDILIRWGGDELMVVARDSDRALVEALAERIRSRIEEHAFELEDGRVIRTTSSIGFACFPFVRSRFEILTWEQVVSVADRALYVAKRSGRNAWVGFIGTERTPSTNLMGRLLENPQQLAEDKLIEVRTSTTRELFWDSPEPHQHLRVEPSNRQSQEVAGTKKRQ